MLEAPRAPQFDLGLGQDGTAVLGPCQFVDRRQLRKPRLKVLSLGDVLQGPGE